MPKFDWWQGTIQKADPQMFLDSLASQVELSDIAPCTPKNGYLRGAKIIRGDHVFAECWWGGNPGLHTKLTGENAASLAPLLQKAGALPSRIDVAEDFVQAGLADELFKKAQDFALAQGIRVSHQGDWTRGEGRTLYLGARSSTAQLVIYEKGHQLGADPAWVRIEARLYPKKHAREALGTASPRECLGASPWVARFLQALGWDELAPMALGTVWRPSDAERARSALLRQYGKIIAAWADEAGGWELLGPAIAAQMEDKTQHERVEALETL